MTQIVTPNTPANSDNPQAKVNEHKEAVQNHIDCYWHYYEFTMILYVYAVAVGSYIRILHNRVAQPAGVLLITEMSGFGTEQK